MYYHDPILYQFYFEALSQQEYEPTIHRVFCELLEHCAKYAQAYTDGADASKAWIELDMRAPQPSGSIRRDDGTFLLPWFSCAYDWGKIIAEAKTSQLTISGASAGIKAATTSTCKAPTSAYTR